MNWPLTLRQFQRNPGLGPALVVARLTALSLCLPALVHAQADTVRPSIHARPASAPITLDGRLEEASWQEAAPIDRFLQVEPDQGKPATFGTTARVTFDRDNLYVGVSCRDEQGAAGVRVQDLRREFDYYNNDLFGVSLDPFLDGRNAVAFQVTPYGTQRDLQVYDGDVYNREWEGVWRVRTQMTDSGWTAEIAIPWSSLRYPSGQRTWGLNVYRIARRTNEMSGWVPWPRNLNPYRMDFSGRLEGLEPPPPRVDLRLRPYLLGQARRTGPASDRTSDVAPEAGGELTWSPSSNSQLDLTVNTDFAQADVDRQVVNLTRFSVFFPERRQFFLENGSLFDVGSTDAFVAQPFFSRRIGLADDGTPIGIQAGARFVRRTSRSGLGALVIRQEGTRSQGPATFAVGRWSRNIGDGSRLGVLGAGRFDEANDHAGARESGTAAIDWYSRLGAEGAVSGMLSRTTTSDGGGEGSSGYLYVRRQSNSLYAGFIGTLVSREYEPTIGFVSRQDVMVLSPAVIADWRPSWRPGWVRGFKPAVVSYLYYEPDQFTLQEGYVQAYVDVIPTSGGVMYPYVQRDFQRPTEAFPLLDGVTVPAGTLDAWRYGFLMQTNASGRLSGQLEVSNGGFYNGRNTAISSSLRVAPSPRLVLSTSYEVNLLRDIGVERVDRTTHLVAPEARIFLNRSMQLGGFWQYSSESRRGAWNARFSWEFEPLSYLYIVYNDNRAIGSLPGGATPLPPQQQLTVKLVYSHQL